MKRVLLSCIALAAGATIAMAQDEPVFPENIAYTLNGQKELAGVTAEQTYDQVWNEHNFTVSGICDADQITIEFETPEGWDGIVTPPNYSIFGKSPKTRGEEDWDPLEMALQAGWTESNSITFNVDGMEHNSSIMFVKGDKVYNTMLFISFNVDREGGVVLPEYPASLSYTLNGAKEIPGVTVTQGFELAYDGEDYLTIHISGECDADELTFEMVTPDGWDSMLVQHDNWSGEEDDDDMWMKAKAPAKEGDDFWMSMMFASFFGATPGNSITFPVDGDEYKGMAYLVKGDQFYTINIDIISDVAKAGGDVTSDEPKYPEALSFTLNGEKELAGVTVSQEYSQGSLSINIEGTTTANEVTLTFDNPEGWDGFLIAAPFAELSEIEFAKTRSDDDWMSLEEALTLPHGFQKANSVTFPVDGEGNNFAWLALIKGDKVYQSTIDVNFDVAPAGNEPSEDPELPESINVTTFDDGIELWKGDEYGMYTIRMTGQASSLDFNVVLDVPEGWDGFVSYSYSDYDVTVEESGLGAKKTRADEDYWQSLDELLDSGFVKGNKFTFLANGEEQDLEVYLYKGDKVYVGYPIALEDNEVTGTYPEIPEEFNVTLSCEGLEVTQGPDPNAWYMPGYVINIDGECAEKQLTVTVEVPEGWDGFVSATDQGIAPEIASLQTRTSSEDFYWLPLDEMLSEGFQIGNKLTFNIDGYEYGHGASMYLFKGNQFVCYALTVNMNVMPEGVEERPTEFPSLDDFKVTLSCEGLNVVKEDNYYAQIFVKGECDEEYVTVTVTAPEGWDGFLSYNNDKDKEETRSLTRSKALDWVPVENMLKEDFEYENSFTFKTDGLKHTVAMYLYYGDYCDYGNYIDFRFQVTRKGSAVESIDAIDSNATYYNVNGAKVANPTKGIYVKVLDGKATKVIVK